MSSDITQDQPAMLQVSESGEVKLDMSPTAPTPPSRKHKSPESPSIVPGNDRDPNQMNDHIKVKFHDIFAEPDAEIFTPQNVWGIATNLFTQVKFWCYRITSLICVLPLTVCWGCYFACIAFWSVWCCIPCLKSEQICCVCFKQVWQQLIDALVAPCCEAFGKLMSGIKITHVKQ